MKSAFLPGLFQALLALVQPHAAASAENGAAFGGLTILGEFPEYVPAAFVITVR